MKRILAISMASASLALSGCGGGGSSGAVTSAHTETPSAAGASCQLPQQCAGAVGTIDGLRTAGLVLASGGAQISPRANETSFSFSTENVPSRPRPVRIVRQPSWQHCTITIDPGQKRGTRDDSYSVNCQMLNAQVTTLAGNGAPGYVDGPGDTALFSIPNGVVVNKKGTLFVTDRQYGLIREIDPAGNVSTFAGRGYPQEIDGTGVTAGFRFPEGIGIANDGTIYVTDGDSNVRKVTKKAVVTTLWSCCYTPVGVAVDAVGNVYAVNSHDSELEVYRVDGTYGTYAGLRDPSGQGGFIDGPLADARFRNPNGLASDDDGNLFVADSSNHAIRKISADGMVTTLAGNGEAGSSDGTGSGARFVYPYGVTVDGAGNVYVTEGNRVRMITPEGTVMTLAGSGAIGHDNGTGAAASFASPRGLAVDKSGNLYVADSGNNMVRKIMPMGSTE